MSRSLKALMLAAAFAAAAPAAVAQERSFSADYSVTLLGLPVGKASFDSTFTEDSFVIEGTVASAGVGRLFDRTTGTTRVEGEINGDGVRPHSFRSSYASGRRQNRTAIRFAGDRVASVVNTPERSRRGRDWVPVAEHHLRAALDPISSTLIRADDPDEVCDRTVHVFDGEMRADLVLSHRHTGPIRGFPGEAVTCDARFVPVAGYREGRRQIEFMRNQSRITVSFARLGDTGLYSPVDAVIGTQIGPLRITASRVETR